MNSYLANGLNPALYAESIGFKPDQWQKDVLLSQKKRIILNCARQTGKSTTTAIKAQHRATYFADSLILILAPSLKQSQEIYRKVVDVRRREAHPLELVEDTMTGCSYSNGSRILCLPGSESSVRGFSAPSLIIADEAARIPMDVLSAVRPMLSTTPQSQLLLLSTPDGMNNSFAHTWHATDSIWLRIEVRADQCPRIPKEFLEQEQESLPMFVYQREYLCSFASPEGSLFRVEDIDATIDKSLKPLFGGMIDEGIQGLRLTDESVHALEV